MNNNSSPSLFMIRSFVIDLLSTKSEFQDTAKEFISWMLGTSCELIILGFAFGGDLRQLRNYIASSPAPASVPAPMSLGNGNGIGGDSSRNNNNNMNSTPSASVASNAGAVSSSCELRCLDLQWLLASKEQISTGQLPGLKSCAEKYFNLPLRKDDQCSDWLIRPLRPSQLQYAALDAVILLILLSQKKNDHEHTSPPNLDL